MYLLACGTTGSCIHSCRPDLVSPAVKTHVNNMHAMTHIFTLAIICHNTIHQVLRHIFLPWLSLIYVDIKNHSQPISPSSGIPWRFVFLGDSRLVYQNHQGALFASSFSNCTAAPPRVNRRRTYARLI